MKIERIERTAGFERCVTVVCDERPSDEAVDALRECVRRAQCFEWLLPVVTGDDTPEANARTALMAKGLMRGLDGEAVVTWAMEQPQ